MDSARLRSLWDMLELAAAKYTRAVTNFAWMSSLVSQLSAYSKPEIDGTGVYGVTSALNALEEELRPLELDLTLMAIEDLATTIKRGEANPSFIQSKIRTVEGRLRDELKAVMMLALSREESKIYERAASFLDKQSQAVFPTAIFDCEEAMKCFAVKRYTACVFHMMRAAETVVIELAKSLPGVTVVSEKTGETLAWGILTSNIGNAIEAMPKGAMKDDWHKAHMFMVSCNRAFRTKTAHPVQTYTEEQAKEAAEATRSFIRSASALVA